MAVSAAVAMMVRGHSAFTATPRARHSSAMPRTHRLIPTFEIVYATWFLNHAGRKSTGGARFSTCGFAAFSSHGRHACEQTNVPRTLTDIIRSNRFIGVDGVSVSAMALALF